MKVELQLTEEDINHTLSALQGYVSDLSPEIADTDNQDFRDDLKSKRISIYKMIDQLKNYISKTSPKIQL